MANVYLIRHGQASWGKSNYDHLSELGFEQSRILGMFWHHYGKPSACYTGGMIRHKQTAEAFSQGAETTLSLKVDESLNEFDHVDVLKCYNSDWHDQEAFSSFLTRQENPNHAFVREFNGAFKRWTSAKFDDYKESFQGFKKRCVKAFEGIRDKAELVSQLDPEHASKNIMVFTSGGVISSICSHYWNLSDSQQIQLNQQLVNTSVTKLMFNRNKVSMDIFNNYSHLQIAGDDFVTRM